MKRKIVSNGCAAEGTHVGGTSAGDQVETENLDQVSRTLLQRWIASLSTLELVPCELYERKKARGDGNCFFYSLLQLNNTVAANELREEMAKWIENNGQVVISGQTVKTWIEQQHIPRHRTIKQYDHLDWTTWTTSTWI